MSRKIKHIIEYLFVRWIIFTFDLFPYRAARRMGKTFLGWLTFQIGGSRRRLVEKNLEKAFPEKSAEERARLVRGQFRNVGYMATEFVKLPRFDKAWMEKYVEWEPTGVAFIEKCLAEKRGIMLNTAHMGCWELVHTIPPLKFDCSISAIAAKISNPYTHEYVWGNRARDFIDFVAVEDMGPGVVKALKQGKMFAIASDQSAGNRGVFVDYLGVPSATHTGASQIAYLADAEMVFVVPLRLPHGRFRFEFVSLGRGRDVADNREDAVRILTLRYIDLLEKYVRKYPGQYFWLHNRWKTKPADDATYWDRIETELQPPQEPADSPALG